MSADLLVYARAGALFLAPVCCGDPLDRATATALIAVQIRAHHGSRGCACDVAQHYGDHPDLAAARMRWALAVVNDLYRSNGHH